MDETHATSHSGTRTHTRRKKRASYVCKTCQQRKVRCDLSFRDPPCTNCRMDGEECSLPEYRRRRRCLFDNQCGIAELFATRNRTNALENSTSSASCQRASSDANTNYIDTWQQFSSTVIDSESAFFDLSEPLFPCFKLLPTNLQHAELSYLNTKSAFEVPPPTLLRKLLTAYVQFAYAYMPIIDLHELLEGFMPLPSTAISPLLFQCTMFAGVAFVDILDLEAAGFSSRGEAHDYYFDKAQLLYDFDCEEDPLTLIQALAMMSHWNQRNDCPKNSLHWLDSSLSLAFKHGLHREDLAHLGSMRNGLRKRIWWSLYSQSKIVSLGMSYPLRSIDQREFNVSLPSLADFDFYDFPSGVLDLLHDCSIVRCIEEQESLARMFLKKVRVCLLLESPAQSHSGSLCNPSGFPSTFDSFASPLAQAEIDVQAPNVLADSYSEKRYQSTKDERGSLSASYLSLSPIGQATKLYDLYLTFLRTFPHIPASDTESL